MTQGFDNIKMALPLGGIPRVVDLSPIRERAAYWRKCGLRFENQLQLRKEICKGGARPSSIFPHITIGFGREPDVQLLVI